MNAAKSSESRHRCATSSEVFGRLIRGASCRCPVAADFTQRSAPFIWGGSRVSAGPDDHKTERVCTVSGPDWKHMGGQWRLKEKLCVQ